MHVVPILFHGFTLKGILFATVPMIIMSIIFMTLAQINHLVPETDDKFDPRFFRHQVITANNVDNGNNILFMITGGLNYQIEHHLFPSVNHWHLQKVAPYVKEICKKHGVQYAESPSLWAALKGHVAHLKKFRNSE